MKHSYLNLGVARNAIENRLDHYLRTKVVRAARMPRREPWFGWRYDKHSDARSVR
jgi:hypothetical protein